jgi:hypothetical protein
LSESLAETSAEVGAGMEKSGVTTGYREACAAAQQFRIDVNARVTRNANAPRETCLRDRPCEMITAHALIL